MGKRPLGRPRYRWVDNIKMDLGERGWGGVDWIGLAQDRDKWRALVNVVMNFRVPKNAGNFLSGHTTDGPLSSSHLLIMISLYLICVPSLPSDLMSGPNQ
jgi:hypothetical protein